MGRLRNSSSAIWLSGAAILLPMAGLFALASEPAIASSALFKPLRPHLLVTRTLYSPLADGRQIVSRRTYDVKLARDSQGYRVDGLQIDSQVEAPAPLLALASIEKDRVESGLFPLRLNQNGMIVHSVAAASQSAPLQKAANASSAVVQQSNRPLSQRAIAQSFIQQLQAMPGVSLWPIDLFLLTGGTSVEQRNIRLADGSMGKVTIEITSAQSSLPSALLIVQRIITTELAGTKRTTREEWALSEPT